MTVRQNMWFDKFVLRPLPAERDIKSAGLFGGEWHCRGRSIGGNEQISGVNQQIPGLALSD